MTTPLTELLHPHRFRSALGFLTRLHPPVMADTRTLGQSSLYFPLAGAVLGALLVLPFRWGLFAGSPWVQAWCFVLMNAWLTRGLHWDGLADLTDALGGGHDPDTFWAIMKDSHTGAFGAMALVLGLCGQLVLCHAVLAAGQFTPLIWSLCLGRACILLLSHRALPLARPGLGRTFMLHMAGRVTLLGLFTALAVGLACVSLPVLLLSSALSLGCVIRLAMWGERMDGVNGDFLGSSVIAGELCALVAWVVFQ